MLKQTIIYSLLTLTLLNARSVESVIGINVGMTSTKNEDGTNFDSPTIGVTYQDNTYVVMPRVDLEYVKLKNEQADSLLKGSINGVYEFENSTNATPYVVAGVGYEYVSGAVEDVFESHPFVQGGGGLNIELTQEYKMNLEGRYLQVLGGNNEDNEFIATAGITIPLGRKEAIKRVSQPLPIKRVSLPVVQPPLPIKIIPSPTVPVNNNECSVKTNLPDLDRDGVEDSIDQCPATPCNFAVDGYGCPIKVTLKINFATNSAKIEDYSMPRVEKFAKFLLKNKGSRVTIVGHTDSVGKASANLLLSERRAKSVVKELVSRGVSSFRIHAEGRGESQPIASNATKSGKAKNRRIEAELSYPGGINNESK